MSSEIEFKKSWGNVFADLGLEDAGERAIKAYLAYLVNEIVHVRHLSQTQAAELLGIDQPKVSALARGRLSGFSLERLFKFLVRLDQDVEIKVQPKPPTRVAACMRIKGRRGTKFSEFLR